MWEEKLAEESDQQGLIEEAPCLRIQRSRLNQTNGHAWYGYNIQKMINYNLLSNKNNVSNFNHEGTRKNKRIRNKHEENLCLTISPRNIIKKRTMRRRNPLANQITHLLVVF